MKKSIYTKEYRKFIKKLKQARKEAGLSQVEVAKKLGKSQSFVSKIESGERRIDIIELKIIAEIYNKPINYFLN
jgi:transcriptional regulator with XRE-family HTH domain